MDLSVTELTWILKWIVRTLMGLAVLYLVTWVALRLMTRLVRRSAAQTDLDLIGQEGRVIRTIRPGHMGKILCTAEGKSVTLNASSAGRIDAGTLVLITALDRGVARTIPKESASPAADTSNSGVQSS